MEQGRERPFLGACAGLSGDAYDAVFEARAAAGENVHGEADLVVSLGVRSVLDAGCGTGRVARELARRGLDVVGVDIDPEMLQTARRRAPHLDWRLGNLATVDLGRSFDAVLMAGNVMLFLEPATEGAVVQNMARHLAPGGLLVVGFQLLTWPGALTLLNYDDHARTAGLELVERWSSWDRAPFHPTDQYAVSVHRRSVASPTPRR